MTTYQWFSASDHRPRPCSRKVSRCSGAFVILACLCAAVWLLGAGCRTVAVHATSRPDDPAYWRRQIQLQMASLGHSDLTVRKAAHQRLREVCLRAGRPGAERERRLCATALTDVLFSPEATDAARLFVLQQLRWIGGSEAVPYVAMMLDHKSEAVRDAALRALSHNTSRVATEALVARLVMATSPTETVALLQALAYRHAEHAGPVLRRYLLHSDRSIRHAAIAVVEGIDGEYASAWLREAEKGVAAEDRMLLLDAQLRMAERWCNRGRRRQALDLYRRLLDLGGHVRCAAVVGLGRAGGPAELELILQALEDQDPGVRGAARTALALLPAGTTVPVITARVASAPPELKAELLTALAAGQHEESVGLFLTTATDANDRVSIAAIRGLGVLGASEAVPVLVELAATGSEPVRESAVNALASIPGNKPVVSAAADLMPRLSADARAHLIRLLVIRRADEATSLFAHLARRDASTEVRRQALAGLGSLGSAGHVPDLLNHLLEADTDGEREQAQKAILAISRRAERPESVAGLVLSRLDAADSDARPQLIGALGRLGGSPAREAVKQALTDDDKAIRTAAVKALGQWPDMSVADDLIAVADGNDSMVLRVLAIRGYVRLVREVSDEAAEMILLRYETAMRYAPRDEERRLILAGLADLDHPRALELARAHLNSPGVAGEASVAVNKLASRLHWREPSTVRSALDEVIAVAATPTAVKQAESVLASIERYAGYLRCWFVSPVYTRKGKHGSDLFDVAFEPESDDAETVEWTPVWTGPEAEKSWYIDLDRLDDGSHRVAYLKTLVWSPIQQRARLEVASDDGVKAWLNGDEVAAQRVDRAIAPGQNVVDVTLDKGWNEVMLKVTQSGGDWAGGARLLDPGGGVFEALVSLADEAAVAKASAMAATDGAHARAAVYVAMASPCTASRRREVLRKALPVLSAGDFKDRATAFLASLEAEEDMISAWEVAGPFMAMGKSGPDLLDEPFAPERNPDFSGWSMRRSGNDPGRAWLVDFERLYGGDDRTAYMRTEIISDRDRDARLEIGSDDGVKVWLNGEVVHRNNTSRPTRRGEDVVPVNLRKGSNLLLVKITQGRGHWSGCVRVRSPAGAHVDGMTCQCPDRRTEER